MRILTVDERLAEIERLWATENTFDLSNIDWMMAELKRTREALRTYGWHTSECRCVIGMHDPGPESQRCNLCTCGLRNILDGGDQ